MTLRVLDPGLCTLLVDGGRPGHRSLGVPVGGAADRFALAIGNGLVGNPPDSCALEFSLQGPRLVADCDLACVLYGAPFQMSNGLSPGKSFVLRAGEILRIGSALSGMRAYLCVRGGLQAARVLGSCSSLAPLESGIELSCSTGAILARFVLPVFRWNSEPQRLRALPGPQAGSFPADAFYDQEFHVASTANRMGLRLHAKPLPCLAQELASEPVCPGSVQVMRDGQCTILGVDGQTIGGYPKIAQVISADVDKLAQLRPGTAIRFVPVSLNEARTLYLEKQSELHEWLTRLQITLGET